MPSDFSQVIGVILAGGFGTRVKHLLPNIPKPMASVANKPFLEWVIRYLKSQGIQKIILSTGYLAEVVETYCATQPVEGIELECCRETKALGTGGGFVNVVNKSKNPPAAWLVTNGDSLIFAELESLLTYLEDRTVAGVILGLSMADASRYGSLRYDEEHNLISFAEKKAGAGVVNAGVYLLRHSLVAQFPQKTQLSLEQEVFPHLLNNSVKLKVHIVNVPFLDIGTPKSLAQAEDFILENYPSFLN